MKSSLIWLFDRELNIITYKYFHAIDIEISLRKDEWIDHKPDPWPKMVTELGSPLNEAMLLRTHSRASFWSYRPQFPDAISSSVLRKPIVIWIEGYLSIK